MCPLAYAKGRIFKGPHAVNCNVLPTFRFTAVEQIGHFVKKVRNSFKWAKTKLAVTKSLRVFEILQLKYYRYTEYFIMYML